MIRSILFLFLAAGCATTTRLPVDRAAHGGKGVYHAIQKGQTLWRIAQAYQVSLADIIAANQIPDVAYIEIGQLIFIPGAETVKEISVPVAGQTGDSNKSEFAWPLEGKVASYFGDWQNGFLNKGIRIQARPGENVCASREGKVVFADYLPGYAQTVILDHQDGFYSIYGLNAALLVKNGDFVYKGDGIGKPDTAGGSSAYFEIRKNGQANNPLLYLPKK